MRKLILVRVMVHYLYQTKQVMCPSKSYVQTSLMPNPVLCPTKSYVQKSGSHNKIILPTNNNNIISILPTLLNYNPKPDSQLKSDQ